MTKPKDTRFNLTVEERTVIECALNLLACQIEGMGNDNRGRLPRLARMLAAKISAKDGE